MAVHLSREAIEALRTEATQQMDGAVPDIAVMERPQRVAAAIQPLDGELSLGIAGARSWSQR